MRIITWNVRWKNKRIPKLLAYALDQKPDIVCLQEVPYKSLHFLRSIKGYHLSFTYDFQNRFYTEKNAYICTLSKLKPFSTKKIQYFYKYGKSLMNKLLYQIILHNLEQHDAIALTLKRPEATYTIVNARLSCAVGTENRLEQFEYILSHIPKGTIPIICGDFNIVDGRIFNWMTGWFRGFRLVDYRINERKAFNLVVMKNYLINVFSRKNTTIYSPMRFQFDHILIPKYLQMTHKEISKKSYGSDHKMLLIDIKI